MSDTDRIRESRQLAMGLVEDWEHLNEEEKVGTVHQIVDLLEDPDDV